MLTRVVIFKVKEYIELCFIDAITKEFKVQKELTSQGREVGEFLLISYTLKKDAYHVKRLFDW